MDCSLSPALARLSARIGAEHKTANRCPGYTQGHLRAVKSALRGRASLSHILLGQSRRHTGTYPAHKQGQFRIAATAEPKPKTVDANKVALGIDVGGSGIKGALVDLVTGEMITERHRIPTPKGASPQDVTETVKELAAHFDWTGPIGCGFPAAVRDGTVLTAANISNKWIGENAEQLFQEATGASSVKVVNDADAAGNAEIAFGAGKGKKGLVLMVTLGTGIGTALFQNGVLVPNTELGHIFLDNGMEGEAYASEAVRGREDLSFKAWAKRVNKYLTTMEALFWPDVIVVGGGVSRKWEKWMHHVDLPQNTPLVPAEMKNAAGIIGAAAAAQLAE